MSQQANLWSRFMAAALQTNEPEVAARKADEALAQYNKRMEALSKLEAELAEADQTIKLREEQVYIGLTALMLIDDFIQSLEHNEGKADPFWLEKLKDHTKRHLHLIGNTWIVAPIWMNPSDPKLRMSR